MADEPVAVQPGVQRALLLHNRQIFVDLIQPTLKPWPRRRMEGANPRRG